MGLVPVYEGKTLVVEVGPCRYYSMTRAEAKRWERDMRDDIDRLVRSYLRVGPHSKTVTTRLEDRDGPR